MKKAHWIALGIVAFVLFAKSDSGRFILAHSPLGSLLYGRHFLGDFLTDRKAIEERHALQDASRPSELVAKIG